MMLALTTVPCLPNSAASSSCEVLNDRLPTKSLVTSVAGAGAEVEAEEVSSEAMGSVGGRGGGREEGGRAGERVCEKCAVGTLLKDGRAVQKGRTAKPKRTEGTRTRDFARRPRRSMDEGPHETGTIHDATGRTMRGWAGGLCGARWLSSTEEADPKGRRAIDSWRA